MEKENNHIEYPWQQMLLDAFLAKPEDLGRKINLAERAILARLKGPAQINPAEHLALEDALRSLKVLIADVKAYENAQSDGDEDAKRFG